MTYLEFLKTKIEVAPASGFLIEDSELSAALKPHQRDAVRWAIAGGRRALFESFGLGKTLQELEYCRLILKREGGKALIVLPLGVRQEFRRDATQLLGLEEPRYITRPEEAAEDGKIYLTNYERVRDGEIDPKAFSVCVLDEAAVLRSFGTTPDHKLWTRTTGTYPSRPKDGMRKTEPEWIEAKDTIGGYVNMKLPPMEANALSEKDWWLVGRYLADGHVGTRGDFFISVGKDKVAEFEEKAAGYFGTCAEHDAMQYRLKNLHPALKTALTECGRGAANKQVPMKGICASKRDAVALLEGYLSGDGNVTWNHVSASSVSRALLLGMAMVAQHALGVVPSVYPGKAARKTVIQGREVNCNQEWIMSWRNGAKKTESAILEDGAWKKVRESVPTGVKTVWSIQVQDDESYTAENCIVKNCPLQFDIVDRLINRYTNEDDLVFDPFGGIGTVPLRALKLGRRGLMTELNGDYFRDAVGYLDAEEAKIDTPTLFDFLETDAG